VQQDIINNTILQKNHAFQFGFYSSVLLISFTQGIVYSALLLAKAIKTTINLIIG
jgi:hypothetical protein